MIGPEWLFIAILIAGFYMAWSIGANDVANAMGTSVGSGALTLVQAVIIAAVLEFSGAYFFGSHVSETVQKGIINPEFFTDRPLSFVYGMLSSLVGVGIWLQLATYFGWPVSTTHAIVGALIGFGAVVGGIDAIYWEHVGFIVSSWFLSPIIGGLLGFALFTLLRNKVLYRSHPVQATKKVMPYLVFFVVVVLTLFLVYDGLKNLNILLSFYETIFLSLFLGSSSALLTAFFVRKIKTHDRVVKHNPYAPESLIALEKAKKHLLSIHTGGEAGHQVSSLIGEIDGITETLSHPDEGADPSEEFKIIEKMFGYLQILSACLMAFAHGANDVANAIGPLSAAYEILRTGSMHNMPNVPSWALALGGLGIVFGLATWGWRVIETIGKKLTELTPTRGFAAEFGAALTILAASRLGMPISTTHTLVGAVIGVGLARGIEALNLSTMRDIILSWLITVPAGAVLTLTIFYILTLVTS